MRNSGRIVLALIAPVAVATCLDDPQRGKLPADVAAEVDATADAAEVVVDTPLAADAPAPDIPAPDVPPDPLPLSGIHFEDVHKTVGSPRQINPNTPAATEPGQLVRLYLVDLVAAPPPIAVKWQVSLGEIVDPDDRQMFFRSGEGIAEVTCQLENLVTGEQATRTISITVVEGVRMDPLVAGDRAVWTLWPHTIEAVHLPTRTLVEVGAGHASSFDGERVASQSVVAGDHTFHLYGVVDGSIVDVATSTMATAWDHRYLKIAGDRLYWSNTNTYYTTDALYTLDLAAGTPEELLAGPYPHVNRVNRTDRGGLVWSIESDAGSGWESHVFDPATGQTEPLPDVDALGLVESWHTPWVVVRQSSSFDLYNRETGEVRPVKSEYDSVVDVSVSAGYFGGHAREAFGDEGEVFLVALDGSFEQRVRIGDNLFVKPSLDGPRLVWTHGQQVWLIEAPP